MNELHALDQLLKDVYGVKGMFDKVRCSKLVVQLCFPQVPCAEICCLLQGVTLSNIEPLFALAKNLGTTEKGRLILELVEDLDLGKFTAMAGMVQVSVAMHAGS